MVAIAACLDTKAGRLSIRDELAEMVAKSQRTSRFEGRDVWERKDGRAPCMILPMHC